MNDVTPVLVGAYASTRFNATRHGVTSRFAVLPWEDRDEYDALLDALAAEHRPQGPTEAHLVEELASILWRKRRLTLAERTEFVDRIAEITVKPGYGYNTDGVEKNRDALAATPESIAADREDLAADRAMTSAALTILDAGASDAYDRALEAVRDDTRGWWLNILKCPDEYLEDDEPRYSPDPAGFRRFLTGKVAEFCDELENDLDHRPARQLQVMGAAWPTGNTMETLARYEVHLDRKFERTLGLLFRLQQALKRGSTSSGSIS